MAKYTYWRVILFIALTGLLGSCSSKPGGEIVNTGLLPKIDPDYSDITIPPNIAPLNFMISEKGSAYFVRLSSASGKEINIHSRTGKIKIPQKKWKKMLENNKGEKLNADVYIRDDQGNWSEFRTINNMIAEAAVDPYIYYRLLYPGYESWSELSINRRDLETYEAQPLIENTIVDENCVNCHSFNTGNGDSFLFHMRGSLGGTYFYEDGKFNKVNLKTEEMKNGAVYPRWHPSGKFVAFSSNKIIQRFHAADNKKVEVSDLESSLLLYDVRTNEIMDIDLANSDRYMDTYPEWSPDGNYLYFCRADTIGEDYDYQQIKYNLYRAPFNGTDRSFGNAELVFDAAAMNKSVSFPRVSPEGRFLIVTLFDYGCFPIWHKEADLWSVDLTDFTAARLDLNSDFADSYHSWSSNGRWLIFSSKRGDGLTARPYISYMEKDGTSDKPFIIPQDDPEFYSHYLKTYNIPEFSTVKIDMNPGEIRKLAKTEAIPVKWVQGNE